MFSVTSTYRVWNASRRQASRGGGDLETFGFRK
jgi:hypothetical protein